MDKVLFDTLIGTRLTPLVSVEQFRQDMVAMGRSAKYNSFSDEEVRSALLVASQALSRLNWVGFVPTVHDLTAREICKLHPLKEPNRLQLSIPAVFEVIGGAKSMERGVGMGQVKPGIRFILREYDGEGRIGVVELISYDNKTGILDLKSIDFPQITEDVYAPMSMLFSSRVGKDNAQIGQLYSLPRAGMFKPNTNTCTEWYELHDDLIGAVIYQSCYIMDQAAAAAAVESLKCGGDGVKSVAVGDIKIELMEKSTTSTTFNSIRSVAPELVGIPDNVLSIISPYLIASTPPSITQVWVSS